MKLIKFTKLHRKSGGMGHPPWRKDKGPKIWISPALVGGYGSEIYADNEAPEVLVHFIVFQGWGSSTVIF
jgi:hypothetical protein